MHHHLALVTGAAGGVGRALAQRLAAAGCRLLLVDRDAHALERLTTTLPGRHVSLGCDLASPAALDALCRRIGADWPDVDLLVNNAAIVRVGAFLDQPAADIDDHLNVNLRAVLHLTHAVGRLMRDRRRGSIVHVVSLAGILPLERTASYAATKFALRGFNATLRMELAPFGVRVSGVFPGAIDTPMLEHEARSGGNTLNFLAPPLTAERVVDAILRAAEGRQAEIYLPTADGLAARLATLSMNHFPALLPFFERRGERGRRAYLRQVDERRAAAPRSESSAGATPKEPACPS